MDLASIILGASEYSEKKSAFSDSGRTLWEQSFCPLFRGCPLVGGSSQYVISRVATTHKEVGQPLEGSYNT